MKKKYWILNGIVLLLCVFIGALLMGSLDTEKSKAEEEITETMMQTEMILLNIGVLPDHAPMPSALTEEQKAEKTEDTLAAVKRYFSAQSNALATYTNTLEGILASERKEIDPLLEVGVFDMEIHAIEISGDEAFASATMTTWAKGIRGKDGLYDIEISCAKTKYDAKLVKEDGHWKLLKHTDYQISGWSDVPEAPHYTPFNNNLNHHILEKVALEDIKQKTNGETFQISGANYEEIKHDYDAMVKAALEMELVNPYEI